MATFGTGEFFASTNGGAYVYRFTSVTRAKQHAREFSKDSGMRVTVWRRLGGSDAHQLFIARYSHGKAERGIKRAEKSVLARVRAAIAGRAELRLRARELRGETKTTGH